MKDSFDPPYTVIFKKSHTSKIKGRVVAYGTLFRTPDFGISPRHVDRQDLLSTELQKDGRYKCDKSSRRNRSNDVDTTYDGRRSITQFIALGVSTVSK